MGHTLLPAPAACPGLGWSGHRPLFLPSPVSSTQSQSLAAGSLPDQVPLSMNCTASIFSVFFQYFEGSFSGCPPPPQFPSLLYLGGENTGQECAQGQTRKQERCRCCEGQSWKGSQILPPKTPRSGQIGCCQGHEWIGSEAP
jgi:hypothetical protein